MDQCCPRPADRADAAGRAAGAGGGGWGDGGRGRGGAGTRPGGGV